MHKTDLRSIHGDLIAPQTFEPPLSFIAFECDLCKSRHVRRYRKTVQRASVVLGALMGSEVGNAGDLKGWSAGGEVLA